MSESYALAEELFLFDDIRSKVDDMPREANEKHSGVLSPEEIDEILEGLEREISRGN